MYDSRGLSRRPEHIFEIRDHFHLVTLTIKAESLSADRRRVNRSAVRRVRLRRFPGNAFEIANQFRFVAFLIETQRV